MSKAAIQNPAFTNEDQAREALEAIRWPDGPYCPHCGNSDQEKIAKAQGKAARPGLYYCAACNGQFTVTVGTVMERSKIPVSKWLFAMHLIGKDDVALYDGSWSEWGADPATPKETGAAV